jgi:hypothetical protein
VSETLCSLIIWNSGRWTKSSNPVMLSVIHYRQNSLHSTTLYKLNACLKSVEGNVVSVLK